MIRNKMVGITVLALVVASSNFAAHAQDAGGFPWHLYKSGTLREVIEENAKDMQRHEDKGSVVLTAGRPYLVKAVYTGTSRPVSASRKEIIELWVKSYGIDPAFLKLFEMEFLFIENSVEHWLPVQTPVSKYFDKELSKGDKLDLYVQFVGGIRTKDESDADWVFVVNEFQKFAVNEFQK